MNTIKERVDELLSRPMTRQEFLKHTGLLLLTVVGVTGLINAFDAKQPHGKHTATTPGAYGASAYGGVKKST